MPEFNPATYEMGNCVECGDKLPEDGLTGGRFYFEVKSTRYEVPGLHRCVSCRGLIESGLTVTAVSLKAAHEWLGKAYLPDSLATLLRLKAELSAAVATGRANTPEAMGMAMAGLVTLEASVEPYGTASEAFDALEAHLGLSSADLVVERANARFAERLREEAPDMTDAQMAQLYDSLDLKREADGSVSYACPKPACPEGNSRHPLGFAEDVMPTKFVEYLVGRLPE
jgi:hypothetical protein